MRTLSGHVTDLQQRPINRIVRLGYVYRFTLVSSQTPAQDCTFSNVSVPFHEGDEVEVAGIWQNGVFKVCASQNHTTHSAFLSTRMWEALLIIPFLGLIMLIFTEQKLLPVMAWLIAFGIYVYYHWWLPYRAAQMLNISFVDIVFRKQLI